MLAIFFINLLIFAVSEPHLYSLDKVVAVVNGYPITHSDIMETAELFFFQSYMQNPNSDELFKKVRQSLVEERLMLDYILKFDLPSPLSADIAILQNSLVKTIGSEENLQAILRKWGRDGDYLKLRLRDKLRIQIYVETRLSQGIAVSDVEIEDYYNQHKDSLNLPLEQVKEDIHLLLFQKKMGEMVDEWLEMLVKSAKIKYF